MKTGVCGVSLRADGTVGVDRIRGDERGRKEPLHTIDPPEKIDICLNCTMLKCQEKSVFCPLKSGNARARGDGRAKCDRRVVLQMYHEGKAVREIADTLCVAGEVVRYHLRQAGETKKRGRKW